MTLDTIAALRALSRRATGGTWRLTREHADERPETVDVCDLVNDAYVVSSAPDLGNYEDDGNLAHERVGFDLHCKHDPLIWPTIEEGDMPKCVHCRDEYEHDPANPKPCIERIAMALEGERGKVALAKQTSARRAGEAR